MESTSAIYSALPQMSPLSSHTVGRPGDPKAVGEAFDGMFASMLIKQMRQSLDNGLFANDSGDVLGGLFDHFLGEHIAKAGGFGLGDMIRKQLELTTEGMRSS